jgi:predicted nucleic-acid-binding Zn-ribbon protein
MHKEQIVIHMKIQENKIEYIPPTNEGGNPLPLTGYSFTWPAEMFMGYTFEDLIRKFGYRIKDAIRTPLYGETGLDDQTMRKKTKWWKFWNRDIREAYIWYTGQVYQEEQPGYVFRKPIIPLKKKIKLPSPRMKPLMNPIKHIETIEPGIIYAPYILQTRTEPNPEYDKFMKKYNREHSCCPKCGSNKMITSLMGYVLNMNHKEDYKDLNAVECQNCGYRGACHDLVPKPKAKKLHEHTYELDGGPCIRCGKTVAETIYEDIENHKNKKK